MSKRLWKKVCAFLLTVCMLVTMMPMSALAVSMDDISNWSISIPTTKLVDSDVEVTVYQQWDNSVTPWVAEYAIVISPSSGGQNFNMPSKPDSGWPWEGDVAGITKYLIIEDGITGISESAFESMINLEEVYLPNSLVTIGNDAFAGDNRAIFNDATENDNILDLSNVTSIGEGAFQNCSSMGGSGENTVTVKFGRALTDIGANAFRNTGLSQVVFSGATGSFKIGESAFSGNRISSLDLFGSGVTSLGTSSFEDNPLTSLTLPDTLTEIGEKAFYRSSPTTTGIVNLEIPASVAKIGASAFANNMQLSQVTIKSEALELGTAAFGNMESNAYHTTLTGDIEYVEGDLSGATSEDIKKVSNVSFSVGAEFKIPAALEAYFAAQKKQRLLWRRSRPTRL